MRTLAVGNNVEECKKAIDRMKTKGWTPITEPKLDDSFAEWGEFRYVAVMERPDEPGKKKHRWNSRMSMWN